MWLENNVEEDCNYWQPWETPMELIAASQMMPNIDEKARFPSIRDRNDLAVSVRAVL